MANRWGNNENSDKEFIFLGSKNHSDSDCSHEIKRCLLLGKKAMTNLDSVLKSRDSTLLTKVYTAKVMVCFSSSHVWMWEWGHKEGWALKNRCFWAAVLQKTIQSPWTARRSNQSILKEINPKYSFEGLMLKLELQFCGHLMGRTNSLKKTLMQGKIEGRRRRGQ